MSPMVSMLAVVVVPMSALMTLLVALLRSSETTNRGSEPQLYRRSGLREIEVVLFQGLGEGVRP